MGFINWFVGDSRIGPLFWDGDVGRLFFFLLGFSLALSSFLLICQGFSGSQGLEEDL